MPGSVLIRRSADSALPRVSACNAFAILRVSGAISVPSPVCASASTAPIRSLPSRRPLPSRLLSTCTRLKPSFARSCPSAVSTAASACGVSTPRAASEKRAVVDWSRICARIVPMMAAAEFSASRVSPPSIRASIDGLRRRLSASTVRFISYSARSRACASHFREASRTGPTNFGSPDVLVIFPYALVRPASQPGSRRFGAIAASVPSQPWLANPEPTILSPTGP